MKKSYLALLLAAPAIIIIAAVLLFPHTPAARGVFAPLPTRSWTCEAMRPVITFNNVTYVPATAAEAAHQLTDAHLGPVVGRAGDGAHDVHNGCGLLAPGQQVYSIKGYRTTFRLAARGPNGISFFEVLANPQAKNGSDLLDISGKIAFLTMGSTNQPSTPVTAIRDPQKVQSITHVVLSAPVALCSMQGTGGKNVLVALLFHLQDGNVVETSFRSDTKELILHGEQCIDLPVGFAP